MNSRLIIASLTISALSVHSQTPLATGHVDVGIAYEDKAWDLHVHDESNDIEYDPANAVLQLGPNTLSKVPAGAAFAFLGATGSPLYLLPNTHEDDRLFLGLGTEELSAADWNGNIRLSLKASKGPGSFHLWDTDSFGRPLVRMNSDPATGGSVDATDFVELVPGSHGHLNWAFSTPGLYTLSFEATGTHLVDGLTSSGTVDYHFEVVPEPGPVALTFVGIVAALLGRRLRR